MIVHSEYEDELHLIKLMLENKGWFFDNIIELNDLWTSFSTEKYCACFLVANISYVEEFIEWLQKTKVVHHIS